MQYERKKHFYLGLNNYEILNVEYYQHSINNERCLFISRSNKSLVINTPRYFTEFTNLIHLPFNIMFGSAFTLN